MSEPLKHIVAGTVPRRVALVLLCCVGLTGCTTCDQPEKRATPTMPALEWPTDLKLPRFQFPQNETTIESGRRRGIEALKRELAIPRALETRIDDESREIWAEALGNFERYRLAADETLRVATMPTRTGKVCDQVQSIGVIPEVWRIRALIVVQQRRNVLWRLGRLELAARSVYLSIDHMIQTFGSDRSRLAEEALIEPLQEIQQTLESFDTVKTRPGGDWTTGDLHTRFARHRPVLQLVVTAEEALKDWRERTLSHERWGHTATSAREPLTALANWQKEHQALARSIDSYASEVKAFSTIVGRPPKSAPAWKQCTSYHLSRLSRLSTVLGNAVDMQQELAWGQRQADRLRKVLIDKEALSPTMADQLAKLDRSIDTTRTALMGLEEATIIHWEQSARFLWERFFPFVLAPGTHQIPTNVPERNAWRRAFFAARDKTGFRNRGAPEPEQPRTRHGHRRDPFVTRVLDLSRSPARVAEVEQGLLAISELDAHLELIHKAIEQACGQEGCDGLPGPEVKYSPRGSIWVQSWRDLPVAERTLGHNIIVLELSRLHLARQVERLATIHAWFSELSSADLSWDPLPDWQQTWGLYTGRVGSFASFLRAIERLNTDVVDATRQLEKRPVSPRLLELMEFQEQLFDLTLDYARLVDRDGEPPIPAATLFIAWRKLQDEIRLIEQATIERDERLVAEEKARKKKEEERQRREAEAKRRAAEAKKAEQN